MNKTDNEIKDLIEFNERIALFCAICVVAGVLTEFIFAAWFDSPPKTELNHWGPAIADLVVGIGVAGEVFFGRLARLGSEELTRRSDERLSSANKTAGEANERASAATQRAEEAALAHAQLLNRLAPRTLTQEEAERFILKMHAFSGVRADLMSYAPGNPEPTRTCQTLINLLHKAGWGMNNLPSPQLAGSLEGIFVGALDGADENTRKAETALIAALNEVGWAAEKWPLPFSIPEVPGMLVDVRFFAPLRIMVGFKPQPIPSVAASAQTDSDKHA
jgi:hypothetical protein